MKFNTSDSELFFKKNDPQDPRLGDLVKIQSDNLKDAVAIVGFPDDEGIKLNGGRAGAALAPRTIRRHLYKMTPSLSSNFGKIIDIGDLEISSNLNFCHEEAFLEIKKLLSQEARVVALGGGHDYGYPHFSAFVEEAAKRKKKPVIINFDAHLDVRPNTKSNHSGTPFFRLLEKYSREIDFYEVGAQDWCNSKSHLEWAQDHGATVITLKEILSTSLPLSEILQKKIFKKWTSKNILGLSLDIDGIESGAGPGASQVFPVGLNASELMTAWSKMVSKYKPPLLGIYEVSPPLDLDDKTSKLAALFIHQFIFA